MKPVSSGNNPMIKEIKSLKLRKYRERKGLFFVEGERIVEEALKSGAGIQRIVVAEKAAWDEKLAGLVSIAGARGYEIIKVPESLFRDISDTENPQGVLAVVKMSTHSLKDIIRNSTFTGVGQKRNPGYFVILDEIQDPGNMGTIIRTADAAGFHGVIISNGCVDVYNPKVLRSTMGSIFHLPIHLSGDLAVTLKEVKASNIKIYAAHLKGNKYYYEVDMTQGAAIIIGNEARGISLESEKMTDVLVKIPMPGKAESLNASVAAGLLMYEAIRQKV
ncbi:MAG: 23S rRNA (guanosine(2251)-2'-O)-methyltransferase RlmB [Clostridiaceae bacterium]|nr:23S rRNA (guanosine(2251)-2'-O)-methyltransferase RlmB [Clostridiaceae bacterium]